MMNLTEGANDPVEYTTKPADPILPEFDLKCKFAEFLQILEWLDQIPV
jgi:hypothetical protein